MELYDAGDFAGAREALVGVIAAQPENPVARLHLGLAEFQLGNRSASASALDGGPLFPHHDFLKRFLRLFWPLRIAEPDMLAVYAEPKRPPNASERKALGEASRLMEKRAAADAESARKQALSGAAQRASSRLYALAAKSVALGDFALAAQILLPAAEVFPHPDNDAARLYSLCLLHSGRTADARAFLDGVIAGALDVYDRERDADDFPHPVVAALLAWGLLDSGEAKPALALLSTVEPMGPDDWYAHILAALAWDAADDRAKADAAYGVAFGSYFLDSWEVIIQPFLAAVLHWLKSGSAPPAAAQQGQGAHAG
ncbi:MAG: hypothetical protein RLY93_03510 [Sumerlaeia bacterium]